MESSWLVLRLADHGPAVVWALSQVTRGAWDRPGEAVLRNGAAWLIVPAALADAIVPPPRSWRGAAWIGAGVALGLAAVLVLLLWPQALVAVIPPVLERPLGRAVEREVLDGKPPCTGEGMAVIAHLTGRIALAAGVPGPIDVTVADDATVNAFTLPGGRIVLMRGLIDAADDPEELAGVIAHEMGHVAHRDPTRLLVQTLGLDTLSTLFGVGGSSATVASLSRAMVTLSYSRAAEASADAAALRYLDKLGMRADGLYRMLGLLRAKEHGLSLGWLATHPATDLRIEATRRLGLGKRPMDEADWALVRSICR